jgi:hypothetical protein
MSADSFIATMPSFLTLPRELRDKILNLVISPLPAPQDISDEGNRVRLKDYHHDRSTRAPGNVLYIEHPKRTDAASLRLVNRQLSTEIIDVIRIFPTKHSYILDITIAERELLPTWLYVPELTMRVDRVYTQIRSIGFPTQTCRQLFEGGDGGPPAIFLSWAFYNIIDRFLKVGPVGRQPGKINKMISVKELIIDVRIPDVAPELIAPAVIESYGGGALYFRGSGANGPASPVMRNRSPLQLIYASHLISCSMGVLRIDTMEPSYTRELVASKS